MLVHVVAFSLTSLLLLQMLLCTKNKFLATSSLNAKGSQILAFQCDRGFWPVSQSSMHAMINP